MILSFADKETEKIYNQHFLKEDPPKHSKDCLEKAHDD